MQSHPPRSAAARPNVVMLALLVALAAALLPAAPVAAQGGTDIVVTVADDSQTDGFCTIGPASRDCTLRDAVHALNTRGLTPPVRILLPEADIVLTDTGIGEPESEQGLNGDLDLRQPVTIIGASGDGTFAVFGDDRDIGFGMWEIHEGATEVTFESVTFVGGAAGAGGIIRAVDVDGLTLTMADFSIGFGRAIGVVNTNDPLTSDPADAGIGGGIFVVNSGGLAPFTVQLSDGLIADSYARTAGGAIGTVGNGAVILDRVDVLENASFLGGGIFVTGDDDDLEEATLTIDGSMIQANQTGAAGGGIVTARSTMEVRDSVITGGETGVASLLIDNPPIKLAGFDVAYGAVRATLAAAAGAQQGTTFQQSDALQDSGGGGVVIAEATATFTDSEISENTSGLGGGLLTASTTFLDLLDAEDRPDTLPGDAVPNTVILERSIVSGNSGRTGGGVVHSEGGLFIDRSTLSANTGGTAAGLLNGLGLVPQSQGVTAQANAVVTTSTFLDNEGSTVPESPGAPTAGGIATSSGSLTMTDTTFARNVITDQSASPTRSVIVGGPATFGRNLFGPDPAGTNPSCRILQGAAVTTEGGNVDDDDSCGLDPDVDVVATPVALSPPTPIEGRRTLTVVPVEGSATIDVADGCPATDIRGAARPTDGDGDGVARCDAGAHEREVAAQTTTVTRLSGPTRFETAIAISQAAFPLDDPSDPRPGVILLARQDNFADALAGTPLAEALDGVILLTQTEVLTRVTADEIRRLADATTPVIILGGPAAVSEDVADEVAALGVGDVSRAAGPNRFGTAVAIAERLGDPSTVLLADGGAFTDPLAAAAVAPTVAGTLLLTSGPDLPPETRDYLQRVTPTEIAVGAPAAAARPSAEPITAGSPGALSVAVARRFTPTASAVGIATSGAFPDALAGGALMAGLGGPVLLTATDQLDPDVAAYLSEQASTISTALIFGGPLAISEAVAADVETRIQG